MKKLLIPTLALAMPFVAFAQNDFGNIEGLLRSFQNLLQLLVPILIGVAVVVLLWGVVQMIAGAGDEEKRKAGRQKIVWGIIGIVVMVAIFGLVEFVIDAFGIESGGTVDTPDLPRN